MAGPCDAPTELVRLAEAADSTPDVVRAALDELLVRSPALGTATTLGILAREPRIRPSRGLLIDPGDSARRRWLQRVAAGAALISNAAIVRLLDEVTDELAESPDLAREVLDQAPIHPDVPAKGRAALEATARRSTSG